MHILSQERAQAQWRSIVRLNPSLAGRVTERFFDEQELLAGCLIGVMRAGDSSGFPSSPTQVSLSELRPVELALLNYAAILLELFRRESGRPLPRLEPEDLERRLEALMNRMAESAETGRTLPKASQPNLLLGILLAYASDVESFAGGSSALVSLLLHALVDAMDAVSGSPEDAESTPSEQWTADRIEEALSVAGDPMRREALAVAGRFRTELVPRLIAAVERVMSPEPEADADQDILWVHALFLLSVWEERSAAAMAARFFSADSRAVRRLPDRFCLDYAPRLMASLLGHEPSRLVEIATHPAVELGFRCDAIRALGGVAGWNRMDRSVLVEHLRFLTRDGLVRGRSDEWTTLAGLVMDAGLRELVPDLEPACRQGWVIEQFYSWEMLQQLADSREDPWPQFRQLCVPWGDIAEVTQWLDEESEEGTPASPESAVCGDDLPIDLGFPEDVPAPFRAPPSVGRNDPCPCGSGRKFKKCCGA